MTFVSYAKTAEEFRQEVVKLLLQGAAREKHEEDYGRTRRDALAAKARRVALEREAAFFDHIVFSERREQTNEGDEK